MDFSRQWDIITPEDMQAPVAVIGCGAIGSTAILALSKMGCSRIKVYDPDIVEGHNLPNQFFRLQDCNQAKVSAMARIVEDFTGCHIRAIREEVVNQSQEGLVISAVDSMASRMKIWENCIKYNPDIMFYIDARMSGEVCRIFNIKPIDPEHVRYYENTLYSDEEAWEEPCTSRAIIYNVFMAAALIAHQVKACLKSETLPKELAFDFKTLTFFSAGNANGR